MKRPFNRKRIIRWFAILVLIVIVGLYLVMPVGMGIYAVFPYHKSVGAAPDGFDTITLITEDGVDLAAWYIAPDNGVAIIVLHGGGGSREDMRGQATMLADHGYGVLALDVRGHGDSEGTVNRLGWEGTKDVGAAVAFLNAQPNVDVIGGLGSSMGAEVLLGAASAYPDVRAIVADGATQRCLDELRALESERPLYRNFTARIFFATVELLSGDEPPKPLLDSMNEAESTHFLLIAGGDDDQEVDFNELFADTVSPRADLWIAPDASHTQAFRTYRDEYEQRVMTFFEAELMR